METPRLLAIESALQATGRSIARYVFGDILNRSGPLDADLVVLCCDLEDLVGLSPRLASALDGVVVVCSLVDNGQHPAADDLCASSARSAVARVSAALPTARVVGGLQQFSADHLRLLALGLLETDAPVTADDREAADLVEAILDEVPGIQAVFAGPLRNASAIEGIATLLRSVEQDAGHPVGFRLDPAKGLVFLHRR